jgi:quercetin dioxygenase-like cupin family protein
MNGRAAAVAMAAILSVTVAGVASAQDAVKVDPKHYRVLVDNAQVRVLRIHYGPHETSVRHSHPNAVVTYLTDGRIKMVLGNGKSIVSTGKAGESTWTPAGVHTPTNLSDAPFEAVLVELKGPARRAKR